MQMHNLWLYYNICTFWKLIDIFVNMNIFLMKNLSC